MEVYREGMKGIPVIRDVDVAVVGGGTAGAVAAIAAAREGMTTILVEQFGFLGGTQAGAMVTPMMPNQINKIPLNNGINAEINERLRRTRDSGTFSDGNPGWFNVEMIKFVLEEMAVDAGAELLYYTMCTDAIVEENSIRGIIVQNKSGRSMIRAKRVIDASGDGDVAFRSGVPMMMGDDEGQHQPLSVRFLLGNIDLDRFVAFLKEVGQIEITGPSDDWREPLIHTAQVWGKGWKLEPFFEQAVKDGVLLREDGNYFQAFTMAGRPGELAFNCPRIADDIDGTNTFHLSRAQIHGRKAIRRLTEFCKKYFPGCENAYIVSTAPMVGVRETRRIIGEYVITADDVLGAKKFDDAIARNNYPIDIHRRTESGAKLVHLPKGEYHEIPYRSLVPLKIENLLVAGRCLSAEFEAQGSIRIQPNCRAMGEAAGVASAMSVRKGITPRKIDGKELRKYLIMKGASLE